MRQVAKFNARRLLLFGGKTLLVLIVLMLLWPLWITYYNRVVIGITTVVLKVIEHPPLTSLRVEGDKTLGYVRNINPNSSAFTISREFYALNYFGIIVLLALMLATPMEIKQRLKLTFIAILFMLFFHVFFLIIYIRLEYIIKGVVPSDEGEFNFYLWLRLFTAIGKYFFPFLIWALLTWRSWLPMPQPTRRPTKEARP
jgi:hypothetical protein